MNAPITTTEIQTQRIHNSIIQAWVVSRSITLSTLAHITMDLVVFLGLDESPSRLRLPPVIVVRRRALVPHEVFPPFLGLVPSLA
jgi:hypothetical protein